MSEKAPFQAISNGVYLSLAPLLLFAQTGGGLTAATPQLRSQAFQLQAAEADVLDPPATLACRGAMENLAFLPLVMRASRSGTAHRPVPAAAMEIRLGVVIIYDMDLPMASAFGSLLSSGRVNTYNVPLADVPDVDLTACDLVIVGHDTGSWRDRGARSAVMDAVLPVAAIGEGGLNLLGAAGLLEGLATGSGHGIGVEATLRGRDAYLFPKAIPLAGDLHERNRGTLMPHLTVEVPSDSH